MVDLQGYLENKIKRIISSWHEDGIYAISFFVYANESFKYNVHSNVTEFSVGYNTEKDCNGADELSEERWNYAFWRQNDIPVIQADADDEGMKVLFDWYTENGIDNIGYEDYTKCYDENGGYIGKGPIGFYELLSVITSIAKGLQQSGFIKSVFGRAIPIIIHELEYPWYIFETNKKANPNGEAVAFLEAMERMWCVD